MIQGDQPSLIKAALIDIQEQVNLISEEEGEIHEITLEIATDYLNKALHILRRMKEHKRRLINERSN